MGNQQTGIIFENKFYEADKSNGRIFIPYAVNEVKAKCILLNDGFAQLADFTRKEEYYNMWTNFFIND